MDEIPRVAHFVFGLRPQTEPFHLLHYAAIESCRRILEPERILFHYHWLPFGALWDEIRPHLTLVRVEPVAAVEEAAYDPTQVPERYRYAHHADFVRLDALIEHGGIYADVDTLFLRPLPDALFREEFVIGREPDVLDERTGKSHPSLCNAFMMARPGARFARVWRERMAAALGGSWSGHSCQLAQELSESLPDAVHVEPIESFCPVPFTRKGLATLLERGEPRLDDAYSVHLWEHLWWEPERVDFSSRHGGDFRLERIARCDAPLARLVAPYVPSLDVDDLP